MFAKFYQNIPNGLKFVVIFCPGTHNFTNCPGTDKGDYWTHSESQPSASLSVDTFFGSCNIAIYRTLLYRRVQHVKTALMISLVALIYIFAFMPAWLMALKVLT